MISLFEQDVRTNDRHSSKGNQLKWKQKDMWYKADYTGYEGLSEYMISHLLLQSSLEQKEFVIYDLENIAYKSTSYRGVKSIDFLNKGWQIITLERLYKTYYQKSLYTEIFAISEKSERLRFLVNEVEKLTKLTHFGSYMNKLLTIDALFLNEDRHMHNVAVLMNEQGEYDYCPIFDHGAGLLSDTTMDYPLAGDIHNYLEEVSAKTICKSFDEQLDISEILYGKNITFHFTAKDVKTLLEQAAMYDVDQRKRIEEIMMIQMRKYKYLFLK